MTPPTRKRIDPKVLKVFLASLGPGAFDLKGRTITQETGNPWEGVVATDATHLRQMADAQAYVQYIASCLNNRPDCMKTFHYYVEQWIIAEEGFGKISIALAETVAICGPPRHQDERNLVAASLIYATAMVKNPGLRQLSHMYQRLKTESVAGTQQKLICLFREGDNYTPPGFPQLVMKGFGRAKRRQQHIDRLCLAFTEVREVLRRVHSGFIDPISRGRSVAPKVELAFRKYFGNPDAEIDLSHLALIGLRFRGTSTNHGIFASNCLKILSQRVLLNNETVVFYYGAPLMDPQAAAATFSDKNKIEIFLNEAIFQAFQHNDIASIIIHELTHACFGSIDHCYRIEECRQLLQSKPEEALTNADSYTYFISDAFQYGWRRGFLDLCWGRLASRQRIAAIERR